MGKILLVDDEPDLLTAMSEALTLASHDVTALTDGRAVLAGETAIDFDLVVTDIIMPGVEGMEIMAHLRRSNPDIKVIAISGGGRIDPSFHLRIARQLGACETLQKPFRLKVLTDTVSEILSRNADDQEVEQSDEFVEPPPASSGEFGTAR